MSITALFAPKKQQADREPAVGQPEIIGKLRGDLSEKDRMIAKLRVELGNLRHRKSGNYNFRLEEVRLMAKAVSLIESGEYAYGLRLLTGVMDDLRPDWRELA